MTLPPPLPTFSTPTPAPAKRLDHASVWQLVLSIIGLILSVFSGLGLMMLAKLAKSGSSSATFNPAGLTPLYWILGLMIVLAIPSIFYASRRIHGTVSAPLTIGPKQMFIVLLAIVLWVGVAYVGQNAASWNLPSALNAPIDLLIVAIPILFLLTLGLYKLSAGSRQRAWGMVNVLVFLSFEIAFFLEMLVLVLAIVLGGIWLAKQPQFASYLSLFSGQKNLTQETLTPLLNQMTTLISKPGLYAAVIAIFCLFVPLIEEFFKPLGVWFIAGKKLTASQGFAAGLISGATFGLIESFSMVAMVSGSTWLATAIARVGTGLLHTLTAGLSGWALAKTWQDQKYFRVALTYTGVVLLHGSWNLFALLMGVSSVAVPINSDLLNRLMPISVPALGTITALMLVALLMMNYFLRKQSVPPALPDLSDTLDHSVEQ